MLLKALCDEIEFGYFPRSEHKEKPEFPKLPPGFLSSMCEIEDKKPVQSRLSEDSEYLHVSALLDLCPRQYILAKLHNLDLTEKVAAAQRIVWEMGKALESHAIRNIREYHGDDFVYSNVIIKNDEYTIQGAADAWVFVDDTTCVVAELKTMNARDFDKLEVPRGDHILQAAIYQWLFNQKHRPTFEAHNVVIILYIAKDFVKGSPYKEFQVNINDVNVQTGVRIALDLALEHKHAREKKLVPKRHICQRQECIRAKQCPVAALCWSAPEEQHPW